jgi:hypothetical protein
MAEPKYIQPDASGNCPDGYVPVMGDDGIYKGCMPGRTRSVLKVDGEIKGDRDGVRSADYFAHKIIDRFFPDSPNKKQLHWQIMGSFSREQIDKAIKDVYDFSIDDKNLYDASDALGDKEKEKELAGLYRKFIDIAQNKDPEYDSKTELRKFLMKFGPSNVLAGMFINNIINDDYKGGYDIKKSDELITLLKQKTDFDDNKLLLPLDVVETEKAINETKKNSYDSFKVDADNYHTGIKNPLLFGDKDVKSDGIYASKPQVDFIYGPEGTPDRVKYEPEVRRPKRPVSFTGVTGQAPVWTQRGAETEFDIYDVFPTGASSKGGEGGGSAMDQRTPKGKDVREAKRLAELQTPATTTTAQPQPQAIQNLIQEGAGTQGFPQQALVIPQVEQQSPVMPKPKQSIPQTPVPNETTSRVPLPPLVNVGTLGSEPLPSTPQATPKTIQGGLGTQGFPQQALAIQEEAPSVSGGVSGNRQNEMMAIADNVEPGVYTDPNAIKAQDVAAKTVANQQGVNSTPVTQPNTQAVQQPKQKMSVLGKLKSLFGFNEENQNDISSFEDAGMTPDGTTGTETVNAVSQNQTLPENVVKSNQQTGTQTTGTQTGTQTTGTQTGTQTTGTQTGTQTTGTQTGTQTTGTQTTGGEIGVANTRGGGTAPPPGSTPGIVGGGGINLGAGSEFVRVMPGQVVETTDKKGVKSKSIEDLIEIGGSGFDDDVYARKLRRQAAMPDLKNEDYYPNQPFSESRTAWGDPIFSGAGAQFPMAAYDAQRKARAQAELDEARKDIMQLKIPEIKTGAYYNAIRSGFTQQVKDIVNDAVARTGGNYQKAKRILDQEGKLAQAQSEWQGTAKMIDEKADVATAYLNKARENPGNLYFPFEGVTAATDFLNGMNEFANGRITPAQLNELDKRMVSADKWEKFKQENMGKLKPTDYIPTPEQLKNITLEDREAFKAVQLDLGGKAPDFNTWLYTQKYTEAALPQVMNGIVQPFFDQEKTAAEQLVLPGEKLEDAKLRVARGIADLFGRQYSQGTVTENRKSNTNIIVNTGTPSTETGFYYNTAVAQPQIKEYLTSQFEAVRSGKMTPKQALQEAYKLADKSGSWIADNTYMRVTTPGKWASIKEEVNPIPYSEMFIPTQSGGFQPYDAKTATGNANESANTQPAHSVILDTERAWMIPDGDGFKMISQEQYKKLGMPESAISYRIDKVNTYRTIDDFKESGGAKDPKTGQWVISPELMKTGSKNAGKIAYQIYPETVEGISDLDVMGSKDTKTKSSGPGKATKISVSKSVENL